MKSFLQLVGFGIALLVAQMVVLRLLPPTLCPDLILIFALAMGLRIGGVTGLVLAFGIGFLVDATAEPAPGLNALLYGTACALTRLFDRALYLRAGGPWSLYVAGYVVLHMVLRVLIEGTFTPEAAPTWTEAAWRIPGVSVVTALCAGPLLKVFRKLDPASGSETGWGLLHQRVG